MPVLRFALIAIFAATGATAPAGEAVREAATAGHPAPLLAVKVASATAMDRWMDVTWASARRIRRVAFPVFVSDDGRRKRI